MSAVAWGIFLFVSTFIAIPISGSGSPWTYMSATFRPGNESVMLHHMLVDQVTGRVYVGASNWIFQLNANLEKETQLETGPHMDSPLCTATSCSDDKVTKVPTNNVNKVLVIDYDSRTLIVCGSVFQGACHKLRLDNISHAAEFINVPVAANDDMSSTFAFIGPENYLVDQKKVLYVGSTFTNNGPYRDLVPAIASRHLRNLDLAELGFSSQPKMDIDSRWRDYFRVKYKYGFFSETHAYFVTVQRKSHLPAYEEDGYVTRLARVCANDPKYHTYIEVTLQCLVERGGGAGDATPVDYNILQDAVVVHAGETLSTSLGVMRGDPVLIAVFAPSVSHTTETHEASAMCIYSLQEIEQKFTENTHMCFNGSVRSRNMEYVAGSPGECPLAGSAGNIFNFCDADLKISGSAPISTIASLVYPNVSIVALTAAVTNPHTVVFLGTDDGYLKKG
uniref:Sema domain-containing protein n=1 Tax=Strigamia maritima TaxID=126957 RepID=T1J8J8_STRMM